MLNDTPADTAAARADRVLYERLFACTAQAAAPELYDVVTRVTADEAVRLLQAENDAVLDVLDLGPAAGGRKGQVWAQAYADLREFLTRSPESPDSRDDQELADDLAKEFAPAFWSAMLEHMRLSSVDGLVQADALNSASAKREDDIVQPMAELQSQFRLDEQAVERILRNALNAYVAKLPMGEMSVRFPFGLRVDRAQLERRLQPEWVAARDLVRQSYGEPSHAAADPLEGHHDPLRDQT